MTECLVTLGQLTESLARYRPPSDSSHDEYFLTPGIPGSIRLATPSYQDRQPVGSIAQSSHSRSSGYKTTKNVYLVPI